MMTTKKKRELRLVIRTEEMGACDGGVIFFTVESAKKFMRDLNADPGLVGMVAPEGEWSAWVVDEDGDFVTD